MSYSINPTNPKCNGVCYMKNEGKSIKNTLTTNQKYICYSVKGNLIRIIKEKTSDKLLLRGHESTICDMKFSIVNSDILCSIDDGTHGANINVWKLSKDIEFTSQSICTLPLSASLVQSHPLASTLWVVSHQSSICLISTIHHPLLSSSQSSSQSTHQQPNSSTNQRLSYNNFSCNWIFQGIVTGKEK